ncbi:immunity 26/phosphotriesterase HocA family protein (plasmid) [Asticcacaulis sp. DW145]|uniref:Imm26 family immunity protein n=1 Tax=Asticcacaulis sp. DW145 TaxID=3095608 RepID=UPI00308B04BB|nr:immunity 26/phosphotriesterase HocA family protein [Asticcacaulis sp. DW145]
MKWGEAALKIMAIKNMITNMMPIKKSNKSICAGDVFVLNIKDCGYILGLVIKANIDFPNAPMHGSNLIYIYNQFVPDFNFSGPIPSPDKLLIPPVWINKMPWTKGLFANIGKSDLTVDKVLKQHCFYSVARRTFVNEKCNSKAGRPMW